MQFNYEHTDKLIWICQLIELLEWKFLPIFNIDI